MKNIAITALQSSKVYYLCANRRYKYICSVFMINHCFQGYFNFLKNSRLDFEVNDLYPVTKSQIQHRKF